MHLLKTRRFLPLFLTQFLGALNDNLFKNAVVMLIVFQSTESLHLDAGIMVVAAGALFIVPYFIFSATAGQLADKYDKAYLARLTKLWELVIVALGAVGFLGHYPIFLLVVLFALGAQSTFFGPIKYALLPQHLKENELVAGNAMVEAATFIAILLGTIIGGLLIMQPQGEERVVCATLIIASLGYIASRFIPRAEPPNPSLPISWNVVRATWAIVRHDWQNPPVFRAILGISWLWSLGAVYVSQFPIMVRDSLRGDESVVTLFLTLFSLGVGVGSMAAAALMKGRISARFVPLGAAGMALCTLDLAILLMGFERPQDAPILGFQEMIQHAAYWRMLADIFLVAVSGGLFVVPLYAIMQHDSEEQSRARTIATNNVVNAFFMVLSAIISGTIIGLGLGAGEVFLSVALAGGMIAWFSRRDAKLRD